MAPASTRSSDVDDVIADGEDVLLPIDDVDVWIDPLDATQVGAFQMCVSYGLGLGLGLLMTSEKT